MKTGASQCEPASSPCNPSDYVDGPGDPDALRHKRIGVLRFKAGSYPEVDLVYERALRRLREAGATLVEVHSPESAPLEAAELTVLLSEFKAGINAYLAAAPAKVQTRSLAQLIEFNRTSPDELPYFGQDIFLKAQQSAGLDDAGYRSALEESKRLAGAQGLDQMLQHDRLDLLVAPDHQRSLARGSGVRRSQRGFLYDAGGGCRLSASVSADGACAGAAGRPVIHRPGLVRAAAAGLRLRFQPALGRAGAAAVPADDRDASVRHRQPRRAPGAL